MPGQVFGGETRQCRSRRADISANADMSALGMAREAELPHSGLERRPFHAETGRRRALLITPSASRSARRICSRSAASKVGRLVASRRGLRFQFHQRHPQFGPFRQDHGTLDQIFELPDVARPGIAGEDRQGLRPYCLDPLAHTLRILLREVADEQGDVFEALPQGRDGEGKDIQTVRSKKASDGTQRTPFRQHLFGHITLLHTLLYAVCNLNGDQGI